MFQSISYVVLKETVGGSLHVFGELCINERGEGQVVEDILGTRHKWGWDVESRGIDKRV